jgi:hypothetical protein
MAMKIPGKDGMKPSDSMGRKKGKPFTPALTGGPEVQPSSAYTSKGTTAADIRRNLLKKKAAK